MDVWKYDQIFTIQKSFTIKQLKFSKKIKDHMNLSFYITSYIESQ
jgi:hypothetical protein